MNEIIGSWTLKTHGKYDGKGIFTPTSPDVSGRVIYSDSGMMTVLIHKTIEPKNLDDIISYSGRYVIDGDVVIHEAQLATASRHRNAKEKRNFKLSGDELILSTDRDANGCFEATWMKEK